MGVNVRVLARACAPTVFCATLSRRFVVLLCLVRLFFPHPCPPPQSLLAANPSLKYTVTLPGLSLGASYVVKVSAFNGVGDVYGPAAFAVPALSYPVRAPSSPALVSNSVVSPTTVSAG